MNSRRLMGLSPPVRPYDVHTSFGGLDTRDRGLAVMLVVSYGGTKAFRVLTYRNGKPHSVKLGTYPQMSVAQAWKKAREYFDNPQQFEAKAETGTFKDIAEQWIKRHVDENKLRSKREIERCLQKYVYPKWGDKQFLEIRRPEVNNARRQAAARACPGGLLISFPGRPSSAQVMGPIKQQRTARGRGFS
jgi:hypothetical protein